MLNGDGEKDSKEIKIEDSDDLLMNAGNCIFDTLATKGAYLIYPGQGRRERNAPSSVLFELFLWNVVIAFFVNILADFAMEQIQIWKQRREEIGRKPFSEDQINIIREEIRKEINGISAGGKTRIPHPESKRILIPLMSSFGIPKDEASALAERIDVDIWKMLKDWKSGPSK